MTHIPRLCVAAPWSGCGKTTVAAGLLAAFRRRGLKVRGFKVGPDFIDPTYLSEAAGAPARNLDGWMLSPGKNREVFASARGADLAVVEGVMGLFDAGPGATSTADMARLLKCPTVLVMDGSKMAASAGALALGCKRFDPRLNLRGAILNRVAGQKHANYCADGLRRAGVPLLGWLPREPAVQVEERHLGLVPTPERAANLEKWADFLGEHLDLDRLLGIARSAPPLQLPAPPEPKAVNGGPAIAVAWDSAFTFYYRENLELLERAGARLRLFSPMADPWPEGASGLYAGGGFPELYGKELAANGELRKKLRALAGDGMPVYGECGGLMYLGRSLRDLDGRVRKMAGLLDLDTEMQKRLSLGYTEMEVTRSNLLTSAGARLRGHEFHYSAARADGDLRYAYRVRRGKGIVKGRDGATAQKVLAGYTHLHFLGRPQAARAFAGACREWERS
ncbi:MAG: cobyrinate a,c-diamide synthase [Halobacteria archaeon]